MSAWRLWWQKMLTLLILCLPNSNRRFFYGEFRFCSVCVYMCVCVCVFSLKFLFWRWGGSRAGFLGALLVHLIGAHQIFLFTNLCHFNYYSLLFWMNVWCQKWFNLFNFWHSSLNWWSCYENIMVVLSLLFFSQGFRRPRLWISFGLRKLQVLHLWSGSLRKVNCLWVQGMPFPASS